MQKLLLGNYGAFVGVILECSLQLRVPKRPMTKINQDPSMYTSSSHHADKAGWHSRLPSSFALASMCLSRVVVQVRNSGRRELHSFEEWQNEEFFQNIQKNKWG